MQAPCCWLPALDNCGMLGGGHSAAHRVLNNHTGTAVCAYACGTGRVLPAAVIELFSFLLRRRPRASAAVPPAPPQAQPCRPPPQRLEVAPRVSGAPEGLSAPVMKSSSNYFLLAKPSRRLVGAIWRKPAAGQPHRYRLLHLAV